MLLRTVASEMRLENWKPRNGKNIEDREKTEGKGIKGQESFGCENSVLSRQM